MLSFYCIFVSVNIQASVLSHLKEAVAVARKVPSSGATPLGGLSGLIRKTVVFIYLSSILQIEVMLMDLVTLVQYY